MRIGSFELDCMFGSCFVLAEVASGAARVLRLAHVRNVRGTRANWLRLSLEIDGRRVRQKSVRELASGDDASAAEIERELRSALCAPRTLEPGRHSGRLLVYCDSDGECELPFDFEVLDARMIPTDFVRSVLLAAYIREDDELRGFAAEALSGAPEEDALRGLYNALLERQLSYQPPVRTRYPDCERISEMHYVLSRGGSCADLSLLLASLLWCRGRAPALLLFPGHMAAGCFAGDTVPAFDVLEDAAEILRMMDSGALALCEATALCSYRQEGFAQSVRSIRERIAAGGEPCQLINVARALRSGAVAMLSERPRAARCPHCGYDRLTPEQLADGGTCPACGAPLAAAPAEEDAQIEVENSGVVQYALERDVVTVRRVLQSGAERVRIAPVWRGHAVRHISERAMERCGARQVALPDSILRIGGYAFYSCANLEGVRLPDGLQEIGAGAFCASGLKRIQIPDCVERVPRLAFSGCAALERVEIGAGVRFIDERAFADCPRLRSVRIPACVERIGRNAFDPGCELLLASGRTVVER